MGYRRRLRSGVLVLAIVGSGLGVLAVRQASAQAVAPTAPISPPVSVTVSDLAERVWTDARANREMKVVDLIKSLPADDNGPGATQLRDTLTGLDRSIAKREAMRSEKTTEVEAKLDDQLAKDTPKALSEAIRMANELFMLAVDKQAFIKQPKINRLIERSEAAAHEGESKGDWFTANELFFRLSVLLEEEGKFRADVRRLGQRLQMIRLYAPEQFWKLRNDERIEAGKPGLPPYNGLGEDFHDKLRGVERGMVVRALGTSATRHIDHANADPERRTDLARLMLGGIEALRTMMTTTDLRVAFPRLGEGEARDGMLAYLKQWESRLTEPNSIASASVLDEFVSRMFEINKTTVALPEEALLHEFGNGAMAKLDEFSAVIWPDEVARFNRLTEGEFRGVGVQIQIDEESQLIKVVTPLEGTPAQRAGVRSGDLIKKINGASAVGISLNQAVDLITGPAGSKVEMTFERATDKTDADGKQVREDIDFSLVRQVIPLATVKGWRRSGAAEDSWDWFIDHDNKIGYVRLLQFTEKTTIDLHAAIQKMEEGGGLNGLILDLRGNPGGLLTEAVSVANTFIDHGTIVSTEGTMTGEVKAAEPGYAILNGMPLAVLINEGSASASEIVSGAIRHYADNGDIRAIVIGARSFGKGSVQNVWPLTANGSAKMKLTTQYYKLPDGRILHRRPGSADWGVPPHLLVEMLPEQQVNALKLRQDADVIPIDSEGKIVESDKPRPDPQSLLDDGIDLQLETALVILQSQQLRGSQEVVSLLKKNE